MRKVSLQDLCLKGMPDMNEFRILRFYDQALAIRDGLVISPHMATLHFSNVCNQNCLGCTYQDLLTLDVISKSDGLRIIEDLIDNGVTAFEFCGGGEPLMIPFLDVFIGKLLEHGCSYGVITNGVCLTPEMINLFARTATFVRISLEASSMKDYTRYKKVDESHWERVLENVKSLTERKKDCEVGIKFGVGQSLHGSEHYSNAFVLAKQLGVDNLQFKSFCHEPEELSCEQKIVEDELLWKFKCSIPCYKRILPEESVKCWLSPLHTVVDYLGDVYLCCYYYYRADKMKLGNLLTTSFGDMWFSLRHRKLLSLIKVKDCQKVDCKFFRHQKLIERISRSGECEFL